MCYKNKKFMVSLGMVWDCLCVVGYLLTSVRPLMVPHAVAVMPRPSVYHVRLPLPEEVPSRGTDAGAAETTDRKAARMVVARNILIVCLV